MPNKHRQAKNRTAASDFSQKCRAEVYRYNCNHNQPRVIVHVCNWPKNHPGRCTNMTTQCKVVKINDVCPNCHFSMPHAENEVAVPPPNVRDHKNDTENSSTQGNDSVEKIRKLSHDRVEGTRAEIMASEQQVEKIAEDMDKERPPNADTTTPNNTPPTASDDAQNRQIITSKDGPDTSGTGKIPDAALAETRNQNNSRELVNNLDDAKEAVAFGEDEVEPWVVVCAEPDLEVVETDQQRTLWQRFF